MFYSADLYNLNEWSCVTVNITALFEAVIYVRECVSSPGPLPDYTGFSMKKTRDCHSVVRLIVALSCLLTATCLLPQAVQAGATPELIRIVMDDCYPPYVFKNKGGTVQGILVDHWRLWEAKTGIRVDISAMDWGEALRRMEAGEFDVIDTVFRTEAREILYDFTKPYVQIEVPLFFRSELSGIRNVRDLNGFVVGIKAGDASIDFLRANGVTNFMEFASYEAVIDAARDDKIVVFTVDTPPAEYYLYKAGIHGRFRKTRPMFTGEFHRAVSKGNRELLNIVEDGFSKISNEEYEAIDKCWRGKSILLEDPEANSSESRDLGLTPGEKDWLAKHPVISVAVDPDFMPVEFIDNKGKAAGISAEYLKRFSQLLNVSFEPTRNMTWAKVEDGLRAGQIDMAAAMHKTAQREEYLSFTAPYLSMPLAVFAQNDIPYADINTLKGRPVAVTEGYAIQDFFARQYPDIPLVPVLNNKAGFSLLSQGKVFAFVDVLAVGRYAVDRSDFANIRVVGQVDFRYEFAMAASRKNPELAAILQKALDTISKDEQRRFSQKWVGMEFHDKTNHSIVWKILAAAVIVVGIVLYWNRRLDRRVVQRTAELRHVNERLQSELADRKRGEESLVKARDAAEVANRAKSQFLATMSHELRTPLNPILGFTNLLCKAQNLTEEQKLWLKIVNQRGQDLLGLIQAVLDMSKIEAGKMTVDRKPLDLKKLLWDLMSTIIPTAGKKGLQLEWTVCPDVSEHVLVDGLRLRQVLLNLLSNALKFTEHGRIDVCVQDGRSSLMAHEPADDEIPLLFSVKDTGIGIPEDRKSAIFEAFEHADHVHAVKYGGAGLGLSIARRLVELMGGCIWVESGNAQGSKFFFTILAGINPSSVPGPAGLDALKKSAKTQPMRVLVVDDDAAGLLLAKEIVQSIGHEVRTTNNGEDAVALVGKEVFEVVLMDIRLPGMDGLEAARLIRAHDKENGRHTVVIALTAYAMEGDKERFLAAGLDGYLAKPVQIADLLDAVNIKCTCR